jgi:predicted nucleic-acid-binding protein
MRYVDANVILRYILEDHEEMSPAAKAIVEAGDIFVTTEVLAEVIYVLAGVYKVNRDDVKKSVKAFILDSDCELVVRAVIEKSLDIYSENSLDFVDCVLAAYASVDGADVETFDRKLQKLIATEAAHRGMRK